MGSLLTGHLVPSMFLGLVIAVGDKHGCIALMGCPDSTCRYESLPDPT
jgi:hypothetical protein